ncbi:Venom carboxylesterase-6 [Anthophora quadrimaculata]
MDRTALLLFILFLIQRTSGQSEPIVQTQDGAVQGAYNYTLWDNVKFSEFKGIPYAQAPVGPLRFRPPVPAQPWNGTLDATRHGSVCPQYVMELQVFQGNEDCLSINVYTPYTNFTGPLALKPVFVWIYGGGFQFGYSNVTLYGPDFLIKQDIVVVTFNYRTGPFGFLALDHPNALGNAGLKDQYLALQWVQRNIAAFGGNPNQVTIVGESAGAISVGYHVLSEKAKGLFSKAVYMSGVPLCPWGHHSAIEAHQNAYNLGLVLGHVSTSDDDLLNFLLSVPAMDLVEASLKLWVYSPLPFRPTIENTAVDYNNTAYVTQCSIQKYNSGNFTKVPTILGYTHDEVLLFLSPLYTLTNNVTTESLLNYLNQIDPFTTALLTTALNYTLNTTIETVVKVASDIFFIAPIDKTQEILAANNSNNSVYYYRQSYETKDSWHRLVANVTHPGVAHFDDVPYLFRMVYVPSPTDPNDPDYQNINRTTTVLANFAKYGDPTPIFNNPLNIVWPPSGQEGLQIDLNTTCTTGTNFQDATVEFYKQVLSQTCY